MISAFIWNVADFVRYFMSLTGSKYIFFNSVSPEAVYSAPSIVIGSMFIQLNSEQVFHLHYSLM